MAKDWDKHVAHAEAIARTDGFVGLRDLIIQRAQPDAQDVVLDVGSGTGLLSLAIAPMVDKVWAIDISEGMTQYLRMKAASAGLENIKAGVSSAISLPLIDDCVDVALSNYCFHHLRDADKDRALLEIRRVLRPGGRLVFADMMFAMRARNVRDRQVIGSKLKAMTAKGPAGTVRLAKNGLRYATRRWEHPAPASWWEAALYRTGFSDVHIQVLEHEGGVASARTPAA